MTKRALPAVAGFFSLCLSLSAQETQQPGQIQPALFTLNQLGRAAVVEPRPALGQPDIALRNAYDGFPSLTLVDGRLFSFPTAFGWLEMTPTGFLPAIVLAEPPRTSPASRPGRDSSNKTVDLLPKFDYVGGEVGFFYGRSTGKFSREVEQGYIVGEVVDGNTHISVGAAYGQTKGRNPLLLGH